MGKILSYGNLGAPAAAGDVLFIGDISTSASNPEIKFIVTNDLFKRSSIWAADGNGLNLYDDGSTLGVFIKDGGYVGVGTNAPTAPLHVYETAANSVLKLETSADSYDSYIDFIQAGTSKFNIGFDDTNDQLVITRAIGSNTDIVVASNGNVGIGTTTSSSTLNVLTDLRVDSTADIIIDASKKEIRVDDGDLKLMEYGGGTSTNKSTGGVEIFGNGGSSPLLYAKVASTTDDTQNFVGIGTNAPDAKLHVKDASANVLHLETTINANPYLRLTGKDSGTAFSSYISSSINIVGIGGSNSAGADTLNISRASGTAGYVHIGGTTFSHKFAVTDSATGGSPTVASLTSNNSTGTVLRIRNGYNTLGDGARSITAYTIFDGTNQIINWINGYFRNGGNSYYGIHYNGAGVGGDSSLNFQSTLNQNLFYIKTDGVANLGGAIHTHNLSTATSGHNTGRFTHTVSLRVWASSNGKVYMTGALFPPSHEHYLRTDLYNVTNAKLYDIAPFDGKLINMYITAGAHADVDPVTNISWTPQVLFNVTASGNNPPAKDNARLTGSNSANTAALTLSAFNTPISVPADQWGGSGSLTFNAGDLLSLGVKTPTTGTTSTVISMTLIYEFKVT